MSEKPSHSIPAEVASPDIIESSGVYPRHYFDLINFSFQSLKKNGYAFSEETTVFLPEIQLGDTGGELSPNNLRVNVKGTQREIKDITDLSARINSFAYNYANNVNMFNFANDEAISRRQTHISDIFVEAINGPLKTASKSTSRLRNLLKPFSFQDTEPQS